MVNTRRSAPFSAGLWSALVLGTVLLFCAPSAAQGGALGKLEPAPPTTDLLAGRLRLRLPQTARVQPRGHSIMAAPESTQDETRVMLDAGKERLVVMAVETFDYIGENLAIAVKKDVADWAQPPTVEPLTLANLRAVSVVPATHDLKREAILVLAVYVASADNTVQHLAFYVNPTGAADLKGVTELSRRIAATITAGPTQLPKSAGTRALSDGISATLPDGFVVTRQDGPDFTVNHLRKLTPFGQPPARIGVYIGGHPSYQYRQIDDAPPVVKKLPGKLFGSNIEWHSWTRGKAPSEVTTLEAIAPLPASARISVHVFLNAASDAELSTLRKIAESLSHKR